MWIFLNDAMLSIVNQPGDPKALLVRARIAGDLERAFPGSVVRETPSRDYRFRTVLSRETVATRMAEAIREIDYGNFKGSVLDAPRHDAYFGVWGVMHREQQRRARETEQAAQYRGSGGRPAGSFSETAAPAPKRVRRRAIAQTLPFAEVDDSQDWIGPTQRRPRKGMT